MNYLFLDRDGVINRRLPGAYVKTPAELEFLPGVPRAIARFNQLFDRTFIITNQQGIGKGLMSTDDLEAVHAHLKKGLEAFGALVDGIYACPHLVQDDCECRKPKPGMAFQAKRDFPEIDFSKGVMVGDSPSDMLWGKNLGMAVAWIRTRSDGTKPPFPPDLSFPGLPELADHLDHLRRTSVAPFP